MNLYTKKCDQCIYFEKILSDYDYSGEGGCCRYPETVKKHREQWCGEFDENKADSDAEI